MSTTTSICGICRDENTSFETRCGHHFHEECLLLWLNQQEACPYCRATVSKNKNFEYALRHYNGEEETLKELSRNDLVEMLCHFCAKKMENFESIITALMKFGWEINQPLNNNSETLLFMACKENNLPMVSHLIKHGADINRLDHHNRKYPINYAVETGNLELLNILIDHGANLNAHGSFCDAPLFQACANAKLSIVERLLQAGLDVNALNGIYSTPLHAVSYKSQDKDANRLALTKLLIAKGANVNARDRKHSTPLHYAASGGFLELVELLIENGADISATCIDDKMTPLLAASSENRFEVLKLLIDRGANTKTFGGFFRYSPLHFACDVGNMEMVKFLIEKGLVDINSQCGFDGTGSSPLQVALGKSRYEMALMLLDRGCRVNLKTSSKRTPLHDLCNSANGNNVNLQVKILTRLLKAGCDPNQVDKIDWETPLSLLCQSHPSIRLVTILTKHGAAVNWKNHRGQTALHHAVSHCNTKLIKKLIELGANVSAKDSIGRQPLHYIFKGFRNGHANSNKGIFKIIEMLKSAGADVNAQTDRGATAFHYVYDDYDLIILKMFAKLGANIDICDHKGRDLAYRAHKRGLNEISDWIDQVECEELFGRI